MSFFKTIPCCQAICFCMAILLFSSCSLFSSEEVPGPTPGEPGLRIIDSEPAWSPDGQWILYHHSRESPIDTSAQVGFFLIRPDGSDNQRFHELGSDPEWSPDGQWIVFSRGGQIYKKTVAGDSLVQLTQQGRNFFPSWSPDGMNITYDSNIDNPNSAYFIWIMDKDGNNKTGIGFLPPGQGSTRMPSWGGDIYHIRYKPNVISSEIYRMNPDGSEAERLTVNDISDRRPFYSPAANKVVFTRGTSIWVMDPDGTGQQPLTEQTQGYIGRWSPDGEHIVYTNPNKENGYLWIMDKDGNNKQQLTF